MPEMGTSGLMSGDGKRDGAVAPVLAPILDSTGIPRRTSARTPTWQPKRSLHGSSAGAFLASHHAKWHACPRYAVSVDRQAGRPSTTRPQAARLPHICDNRGSNMKARVFVSLKSTVLDPQGQTVRAALNGLGYSGISDVRQGKFFDIGIAGGVTREQARKDVETRLKTLAR